MTTISIKKRRNYIYHVVVARLYICNETYSFYGKSTGDPIVCDPRESEWVESVKWNLKIYYYFSFQGSKRERRAIWYTIYITRLTYISSPRRAFNNTENNYILFFLILVHSPALLMWFRFLFYNWKMQGYKHNFFNADFNCWWRIYKNFQLSVHKSAIFSNFLKKSSLWSQKIFRWRLKYFFFFKNWSKSLSHIAQYEK